MSTQVKTENPAKPDEKKGPFNGQAFVLGLLFPGLGHFSIGERGRAYRILAGFLVLWIGGLLIGGLGSVRTYEPEYATGGNGQSRKLWFFAQMGAGPIALVFDQLDKRLILNAPPEARIASSLPPSPMGRRDPIQIYGHTAIGHAAELGTLFCALAGMMNFAVAIDAGRHGEPNRRSESSRNQTVRIRRSGSSNKPSGGAR